MDPTTPGFDENFDRQPVKQVLGYLNFSSGSPDPQFLAALDALFRQFANAEPVWSTVLEYLETALNSLEAESAAFADSDQARSVLKLLRDLGTAYSEFHADTLAHQAESDLFNSFFVGRAAEALLSCLQEGDNPTPVTAALKRLNDYVGYRPVPTLESQKLEPYAHEWIRPIPLYVADAGTAVGPYEEVVEIALQLLRDTDSQLLQAAYFYPERLDELALDPRAYDFDHPANKRPNHHFGQWDERLIDNQGYYRRFVIQQVTIDALLSRVTEAGRDHDEILLEAGAVLAGTILMSSGISGYGPETHDSSVTLSSLLVRIAAYRDAFYVYLLDQMSGAHGARLRVESERLHQPFAAARQDLNRRLTECRAAQLQSVSLSRIYARMGRSSAALQQAELIHVPAARLTCEIECHLMTARMGIPEHELSAALEEVEAARRILLRAIECGAVVDPWNILGFDGNFSLFHAIENSLRDYRVDDLVELVEEMIETYAQIWSAASGNAQPDVAAKASTCFESFAQWWHQFAAHELDNVLAENPLEVYDAARNVADALAAWHRQGEAAGDIGFWAPHVQEFKSCRAYWLVVRTLLGRQDKVASLGLLMHWLSESERIPLEHGEISFFQIAVQWISAALDETEAPSGGDSRWGWKRLRRFFDYLEANAGEYWDVPEFAPSDNGSPDVSGVVEDDPLDADEDDEELFGAAYENVVYRDSTADGVEGNVFEFQSNDEDYLQLVSRSIVNRLIFLDQLACIWKVLAVAWTAARASDQASARDAETAQTMDELLGNAARHLTRTAAGLQELLEAVSRYRLNHSGSEPESMADYDRLRLLKDSLVDQVVNTHVSVLEGRYFVFASQRDADWEESGLDGESLSIVMLLRPALENDSDGVARQWEQLRKHFQEQPILYVPITRGGSWRSIVGIKTRQKLVQDLLFWMPRLGLLSQTYELIELVREMERSTPVGAGAITEFDDLFEVGCRAFVMSLLDSIEDDEDDDDDWLVSYLQEVMEPLLRSWLAHSRTLRLSVLEQLNDDDSWQGLVAFIQRFGRDLFTQRFLNLGNIRGILHQGVENWLELLQDYSDEECYQPLLDALDHDLPMSDAVDYLTLILEAIVESYSEYRDYNSTTTQSDRGDLLYTLLDFLRLRVSYDRIVWNLRPVVLAHQVLAARGRDEAAAQWRERLDEKIQGEAQRHMTSLGELQQRYAMRLPSVEKRLNERFLRPLLIDRLCALIEPCLNGDAAVRDSAFKGVQAQANALMEEPSGAGLDVPTWLVAMEEEVRNVSTEHAAAFERLLEKWMLPPVRLSLEQIQAQIGEWSDENR